MYDNNKNKVLFIFTKGVSILAHETRIPGTNSFKWASTKRDVYWRITFFITHPDNLAVW